MGSESSCTLPAAYRLLFQSPECLLSTSYGFVDASLIMGQGDEPGLEGGWGEVNPLIEHFPIEAAVKPCVVFLGGRKIRNR